jgi:hypothetical protein
MVILRSDGLKTYKVTLIRCLSEMESVNQVVNLNVVLHFSENEVPLTQ